MKATYILASSALLLASCSRSTDPPPASTTVKALSVAAPAPTESVDLGEIQEAAEATSRELGKVSNQVIRLRVHSEESERLNEKHLATINKLSSQLEDKDVSIQLTLTDLRDEVEGFAALDMQRRSAITMLETVLFKAQKELEDLRITHVPKAALQALAGELEKAKLREVGKVSKDIVVDLETELAEVNEDVVKYKNHYDSRWSTYAKIVVAAVLLTYLITFLAKLYLRSVRVV